MMLAGKRTNGAVPLGRLAAEASWRAYESELAAVPARPVLRTEKTNNFNSLGFHFGKLSIDLAQTASAAVYRAERQYLQARDCTPGFASSHFTAETIQKINRGSYFRNLRGSCTWILADVLDAIKDEVAECLGSPWRTLNVRAWSTPPRTDTFGMYAWHTDGHVSEICKIMLYLTPLSDDTGAIDFRVGQDVIRHRCPEPGAWVIFRNSAIEHRGAPGAKAERLAVEITLCRSAAFDVRPRFAGLTAHWPFAPWIEALDGCEPQVALTIAEQAVGWRVRLASVVRTWARRLAVRSLEGALYAAAPFTRAFAGAVERVAPTLAVKLRALDRRAKEQTLHEVAEYILREKS